MGISTLQSYQGAQAFEAIGLNKSIVEQYFTGTPSRIEGVDLDVLAKEVKMRHEYAFQAITDSDSELEIGRAVPLSRRRGISSVQSGDNQQAAACGASSSYRDISGILPKLVDDQSRQLCTLRGLHETQESRTTASPGKSGDRPAKSSNGLPPAPCRSAPSARKFMKPWRLP